MTDFNLQATVKAGTEYNAPWLTIGADNPEQLQHYLQGVLGSNVLQLVHEVSQHFQGQGNVVNAGAAAPVQQQPPAQEQQWNNPPQQPQYQQPAQTPWNQPQQQAPANNGAPQNGQPHPANKACGQCGTVLQYKSGTSQAGNAYKMWACPNGRRKGDGHESDFIR